MSYNGRPRGVGNLHYCVLPNSDRINWNASYTCHTEILMRSRGLHWYGAGICALRECIVGWPCWQPLAECCARPLMNIHVASVVSAGCCDLPRLKTGPRWWWVVALGKGPVCARRIKQAKPPSSTSIRSGELATKEASRPPCGFSWSSDA